MLILYFRNIKYPLFQNLREPHQNHRPLLLPQQQMANPRQLLQHQLLLRQVPRSKRLPLPVRNAETTRTAGRATSVPVQPVYRGLE